MISDPGIEVLNWPEVHSTPQSVADPVRSFIEMVPAMVLNARRAADTQAISYRGLKVGAELLALHSDIDTLALFTAGNLKLHEEVDKFCAEMSALQAAEESGCDKAIGIVIAGPTDPKLIYDITEKHTPTLDSCRACICRKHASAIVSDDLLVVTTGHDKDHAQVHTFKELVESYAPGADGPPKDRYVREGEFNFESWDQRLAFYDELVKDSSEIELDEVPACLSNSFLARIALTARF